MVVAAFSLAVYNGGDISEAVNIARRVSKQHDESFHELLEPQNMDSQTLSEEVLDLAASVKHALRNMTDEQFVSQAMAQYPKAPYSDLVGRLPFLPLQQFSSSKAHMITCCKNVASFMDGSYTDGF